MRSGRLKFKKLTIFQDGASALPSLAGGFRAGGLPSPGTVLGPWGGVQLPQISELGGALAGSGFIDERRWQWKALLQLFQRTLDPNPGLFLRKRRTHCLLGLWPHSRPVLSWRISAVSPLRLGGRELGDLQGSQIGDHAGTLQGPQFSLRVKG